MVSFSPNWAAIASVLGSAVAAPRGQWAQGAQMGAQNYQSMQDAELNRQYQEQRLQLAQEEAEARRAENQRKTEMEAQWKAVLPKLFGGEVQAPANGMSQAQFGGAPTEQTAGLFSDLDPTRKALLQQALQYASPGEGAGFLLDYATKEPDQFKPNIEEFFGPNNTKFKGYIGPDGNVVRVGDSAPLWEPDRGGGEYWEAFTDPKTGKTGQRNRKTGKIDWDPGQTGGIQVDTNGDGNPDIIVGGPGMRPLSDSGSQQTLRATMIDQALKDIEGIKFENVSPTKAATGQWLSEKNPVGEAFAQGVILNDDEKRLLAVQGKIQEAVISAITGAAYTEEQKNNMRAAYVPLPTDGPARRLEKLKGAAQFLKQLDKNSGYNRIQDGADQEGWQDINGVKIRKKPNG